MKFRDEGYVVITPPRKCFLANISAAISKSGNPAPLSKMLVPSTRFDDSIKTCFNRGADMGLEESLIELIKRATAPAMTGDATDVPERRRHPLIMAEPIRFSLYIITSGFTRPYPIPS